MEQVRQQLQAAFACQVQIQYAPVKCSPEQGGFCFLMPVGKLCFDDCGLTMHSVRDTADGGLETRAERQLERGGEEGEGPMDTGLGDEDDELPVGTIDAYWLQRELGKFFNDPMVAQKTAEEVLATLTEAEERDCENKLVVLLDYDKFDLIKLLLLRGYAFNRTADFETVREIKEKLCYVAYDPKEEQSLALETTTLVESYTVPDGRKIRCGRERYMAPEAMFNPALIDLTGLPTGFLTARPTLFDLLDQLRESRMVPEPKDFRSWRQHMNNLESAAATGHHVETWSLPGGQTYRVTGRPHPDGAVAFLFEDITSEISLTRKFRADLSLGENVIDGLDDGLAAFSSSGQILMTNQSYRQIWGGGATTLAEALSDWEGRVENGPGFAALRARLTAGSETSRDTGLITGPDGALLDWRVTRIGGARQLLRFRRAEIAATTPGQDGAAPLLTRAVGAD